MQSPVWYGQVRYHDGTAERIKLCENKTAAEMMLRDRQKEADTAGALGLPVERLASRARPLAAWLDDYEPAVRPVRAARAAATWGDPPRPTSSKS